MFDRVGNTSSGGSSARNSTTQGSVTSSSSSAGHTGAATQHVDIHIAIMSPQSRWVAVIVLFLVAFGFCLFVAVANQY